MSRTVVIIKTGSANIASVVSAFARLGFASTVTSSAETVRDAELVVLPGVGAFGPAMKQLRRNGLGDAIKSRLEANLPLLAICLGLQLLFESSEESPGIPGLSIVPGTVTRFQPSVRTPQMGWNEIQPPESGSAHHLLLRPSWMYFANSYCVRTQPPGWACAFTGYGGDFVSAMQRGRTLACQFHPELSGADGLSLISRWAAFATAKEPAPC